MVRAPAIDLLDVAVFAREGQPHSQFAWLRKNDPVHWHPEPGGPGFWAVTRYEDVRQVSRQSDIFSSWLGGVGIPDLGDGYLAASRNMMLVMDPPEHTRFRKLVSRGFMPRSAEAMTPRIKELAGLIIDNVIERGECDLVRDIAGEPPSFVIAEMLGIPLEDGRRLYELTEVMHTDPATISPQVQENARLEMLRYASTVAVQKRREPATDFGSILAAAEGAGEPLTEDEFNWFFLLLVNAGGDTTRNLVSGGMEALFNNPSERERLHGDLDGLLPTAVEEMLRYVSPVVHFRRTATQETRLGGQRIAKGDKVVMFYGSANRDEEAFREPDRFDVGRAPNEHVAFGAGGVHFCLGAHLARIEISAMLREILTRIPDVEPAGPIERLESVFIAGPKRLPVRFTPGSRGTAANPKPG